ncbi:type II toxin-antitoxin system ParD family antitoxin [Aquamicrobium sp. LC103]|uniref:type II toxin-antitoxin system ParD family antitoxin n=1 Tax=Aquamicrobium sp. LC103 TaxID=1120658 RepID=UPI00063EABBB|nr:type II toxin-antitoxin system ParD family antitoxin [Aquamicrobium sp. LC103]TKT81401.1 type II toxin-antitoxin system ParD family antitoxin [Aquamicrobium sp. LC103]
MATVTVSVPDQIKEWIDAQVREGQFSSSGDYISELVRRDRDHDERLAELRRIVAEGLESGISTMTFEERIAEGNRIARERGLLRD